VKANVAIWAAALLVATGACTRPEPPLPGERFDIREGLEASLPSEDGEAAVAVVEVSTNEARPISLPATVNHAAWTHRGGNAQHKVTHPALSKSLTKVWTANIGSGNGRKTRLSSDPVVADGRVYTVDSQARVSAVSTSGSALWSVDLTPPTDRNRDATGGGVAYGNGRLAVTTGFGELILLDPATGGILWRQKFDAPVSGAPTILGDKVYVISRDNGAFAVEMDNGRLAWAVPGAPSPTTLISGAGPAVTERLAVFPSGASEVVATLRQGGIRVWGASVAGERRGRAYAGVSDISSDPVIVGSRIYVGSQSGRYAVLNASNGERIWTATEGSYSPGWPVGGSVFITTDQGQLVRLDDETGEAIWAVDLPYFTKERPGRRKAVYAHFGPVLAGGRLVVASDDGQIRSFDPVDGRLLSTVGIPGGAASMPAIVNGTLYILSTNGQLHAFR
jgi:outer membrane protein assembly factor BamB